MSLEDDARKGVLAAQLLDSLVFTEVWKTLEDKYAQNWLISRPEDTEAREHLWRLRLNMLALKSEIERLVRDGKAAQAEIAANEKAERVRRLNIVPA